jgi:hypothetical protein
VKSKNLFANLFAANCAADKLTSSINPNVTLGVGETTLTLITFECGPTATLNVYSPLTVKN